MSIEWLPKHRPGTFLYLRPAIIGNGEQIGVTAPSEVLMFIVAVGWPDLSSGTRPGTAPKPPGLKLLASKSDVRAWPGGFGYAKVGANCKYWGEIPSLLRIVSLLPPDTIFID
jgi:branched-chain amino acid aminotransferase